MKNKIKKINKIVCVSLIILFLSSSIVSSISIQKQSIENDKKIKDKQSFTIHVLLIFIGTIEDVVLININDSWYYNFIPVNLRIIQFYYPFWLGVFVDRCKDEDIVRIDKSMFHGIVIKGFICGWEYFSFEFP